MITTNTTELKQALQSVASVVESRSIIPILDHVMIDCADGVAELTCSNSDMEVKTRVSASGECSITLPAKKLLHIVSNLPNDADIKITDDGKVTCKRSKYKLTTLPAAEFPKSDNAQFNEPATISGHILGGSISRVSISMADQDVRFYLNGMLFDVTDTSVTMVSTDGHRMTLSTIGCDFGITGQFIVPRKTIAFIQRMKFKSDVELSFSDNHVSFECEGIRAVSKLIDGRFPDYERVMPDSTKGARATVDREALSTSLSRSAILANQKYNGARLTFTATDLTVESNNPEQEESSDVIDSNSTADNEEIGVNLKYMSQALAQVESDNVTISHIIANEKFLIEDGDTSFVIMPMRL